MSGPPRVGSASMRIRFLGCVAGLVLLATATVAADNEVRASAQTRLGELQSSLRRDKDRGDWQDYLHVAEQLRAFVNGSPAADLEIARAQLNLGLAPDATSSVTRVLSMGASHPILASPLFQPVTAALSRLVDENKRPVHLATASLTIADTALLPEDIDYDRGSGHFFVTSVLRAEVDRLDRDGSATTFARSPDHWPMVALKIDSGRRRLWATAVAFEGFVAVPAQDWGRSAVLEYDLDRGTLLRRIEGPPHASLGDMTLTDSGDPIVSDGEGGGLYRVVGRSLERLDHGEFISPQTPAFCPGEPTLFVPDYVRGLAAVDLATGTVRWLATRGEFALDETDGLYCHGHTLLAVQNGATHPRVVAFGLEAGSVVEMKLIERSADGDFTHGVVVDGQFYYLAVAGWRNLDDKGQQRSDASPRRPVIMVTGIAVTP
jgi:hypothetical protein